MNTGKLQTIVLIMSIVLALLIPASANAQAASRRARRKRPPEKQSNRRPFITSILNRANSKQGSA
jgi:hypothetical protein